MKILKFYLISSLFFIIGCNSKPNVITLDSPMFVTESVADAGMDSIGFLMRKHVIVVTVKDKNELHVYGAMNGKFKKSIKRENAFPNGIPIMDGSGFPTATRDYISKELEDAKNWVRKEAKEGPLKMFLMTPDPHGSGGTSDNGPTALSFFHKSGEKPSSTYFLQLHLQVTIK